MTIVVGVVEGGIVAIGADTQGSCGWDKLNRKDKKVFKAHSILYGFTGSYRMGQILQYHSEEVLTSDRQDDTHAYVVKHLVPMWRRILTQHGFCKKESGEEKGGTFLVGVDGRLFCVHDDFQVAESAKPYDAVGCGAAYALGALFVSDPAVFGVNHPDVPGVTHLKRAIAAALEFSNGCGGSVDVITSEVAK